MDISDIKKQQELANRVKPDYESFKCELLSFHNTHINSIIQFVKDAVPLKFDFGSTSFNDPRVNDYYVINIPIGNDHIQIIIYCFLCDIGTSKNFSINNSRPVYHYYSTYIPDEHKNIKRQIILDFPCLPLVILRKYYISQQPSINTTCIWKSSNDNERIAKAIVSIIDEKIPPAELD